MKTFSINDMDYDVEMIVRQNLCMTKEQAQILLHSKKMDVTAMEGNGDFIIDITFCLGSDDEYFIEFRTHQYGGSLEYVTIEDKNLVEYSEEDIFPSDPQYRFAEIVDALMFVATIALYDLRHQGE